jgi:aspartate aminotransferase
MLAPELEALLEPLERFESIRRRAARLGNRVADLSYANPYDGPRKMARTAIAETLAEERQLDLQYSPFGGQTLSRRAVADSLNASHGLPFAYRDVVLTPGAMSALHLALRVAGRAGGEVVVPVPCWLDYPLYARFVGLTPRMVPLPPADFDLDVGAIGQAISERTCAVLLSHPANPTGKNYSADALSELSRSASRAESRTGCRITLIADETHRDFMPPGRYRSAATFFDRTIVVYSFGKYHFMQGQRLGYAAVSPRHPAHEEASEELVRWSRITGFATPTALMQRAVPRLLRLRYDLHRLDEWRVRLVEELRDAGYRVVQPEATLFVYAKTPGGYDDDFEFVDALASKGLVVMPAPVFHHAGYFRLSLTGSEQMLERGIAVLRELARR